MSKNNFSNMRRDGQCMLMAAGDQVRTELGFRRGKEVADALHCVCGITNYADAMFQFPGFNFFLPSMKK